MSITDVRRRNLDRWRTFWLVPPAVVPPAVWSPGVPPGGFEPPTPALGDRSQGLLTAFELWKLAPPATTIDPMYRWLIARLLSVDQDGSASAMASLGPAANCSAYPFRGTGRHIPSC
jgi:hypothetical protein